MIPVCQPEFGQEEALLVAEALAAGEISGTAGRFIGEFEAAFADYCGCRYGIATTSGSTALHLACAVVGIRPGDEVIVSAATNIASANAVAQLGAVVVPIDVESDTWNLDPALLRSVVSPRARAIMPVHLYGHPVDMAPVVQFATAHRLAVIEDCAEAHGALYRGQKVGSLGTVGCFSFYANKIITTGEGGMLVTDRGDLAERARSLRNLAFGKPRFRHEAIGFNYRLTNLQAAIGVAQLARIEAVIASKRRIARAYLRGLDGIKGLRLPTEKPYARNVYWMFALVVDPDFGLSRDDLAARLERAGIETRTMFCPLNLQPGLLKAHLVRATDCPQAEELWERGLYLPSGIGLTDETVANICEVVREAIRCA